MATVSKVQRIDIVAKDKSSVAINKISKSFQKMDKNIQKSSKSLGGLNSGLSRVKTAFIGLAGAIGAREITRSIDSYQLIQDRIRSLWGETEEASSIFNKLAKAADETNAPIETLADGFARMSISTKDMGLSVDETIRGVKSLQQTIRLSGSSVMEANSVFLQFSQSMGLGSVQGQELRAVMLNNAKFAALLAEEWNTTKGNLRKLGEESKIVADRAFNVLLKKAKELDAQAKQLNITFGQAGTKVVNAFRLELKRLNEEFALSTGAKSSSQFLVDNMKTLFQVGSAIVAAGVLGKIASGILAISAAIQKGGLIAAFGPGGWFVAAAAALGALSSYLILREKKMISNAERLKRLNEDRLRYQNKINEETKKGLVRSERSGMVLTEAAKKEIQFYQTKLSLVQKDIDKIGELKKNETDKAKANIANQAKLKALAQEKTRKQREKAEAGEFKKLNDEYRKGNMLMDEYLRKLQKHEELKVTKQFEKDKISAYEYAESLKKVKKEYTDLIMKMEENSEGAFAGIRKGAKETVDSIGTLANQISGVTQNAFKNLEDALFDFVKTGKLQFKDFVQSLLDDLTRVMIRMSIIEPLAGALGSFGGAAASGGGGGASAVGSSGNLSTINAGFANGGAFGGGNVIPFASGGVTSGTSFFPMSGGRTGMMGEAGPEAIMPLKRGKDGKLGVGGAPTIVNVVNNSDNSDIETSESVGPDGGKQIDVLIVNKVKEAIGDGRMDKTMKQTYGLNRRAM